MKTEVPSSAGIGGSNNYSRSNNNKNQKLNTTELLVRTEEEEEGTKNTKKDKEGEEEKQKVYCGECITKKATTETVVFPDRHSSSINNNIHANDERKNEGTLSENVIFGRFC